MASCCRYMAWFSSLVGLSLLCCRFSPSAGLPFPQGQQQSMSVARLGCARELWWMPRNWLHLRYCKGMRTYDQAVVAGCWCMCVLQPEDDPGGASKRCPEVLFPQIGLLFSFFCGEVFKFQFMCS